MKILLLSISCLLMSGLTMARVKIPVCVPCEEIELIYDLPNTEEFTENGMSYIDVGYIYENYGVLWVPIWNTDGEYVLYDGANDIYYEVDEEFLDELQTAYDFELPESPLNLWQKFGGKAILLIFLALFIYGSIAGGDDEEKEEKLDEVDKTAT